MKTVLLLTAILITPLLAEVNFSGNWMLNVGKSQYGQFPAPEVMLRTVDYKNNVLHMTTYQKGAQGEVNTDLKYTTDGKPSINPGKSAPTSGTARWQGDQLVIESAILAEGAQLSQSDKWTLSADGKTLTINTHVKLPNGDFDVKQVFEKAPIAAPGAAK